MTQFHPGDAVVYLTHGFGVIERRERRVVLGEERDYFVIAFPASGMTSLVPVDHAVETGLRAAIGAEDADAVLGVLREKPARMGGLWSARVERLQKTLKSAEPLRTAEVVRDLWALDQTGKISSAEHLLRRKATSLLAQELGNVWGIEPEEAAERIEAALAEAAGVAAA